MQKQISHWQKLNEELLQQTRVFSLHSYRMRSPEDGHEDDFFVIHSLNWVNIIPLTDDGQVVFVRQFRHGVQSNTLEIPGGILGGPDEDPQDAAVREMEEETGYVPTKVEPLAFVHPNPATHNNSCFSFLATGVSPQATQNLDPAEDISVELFPLKDVPKMILSGEITHTLVVSAFFQFFAKEGFSNLTSQGFSV